MNDSMHQVKSVVTSFVTPAMLVQIASTSTVLEDITSQLHLATSVILMSVIHFDITFITNNHPLLIT